MGVFGDKLAATVDPKQLGVAFLGYLIFSLRGINRAKRANVVRSAGEDPPEASGANHFSLYHGQFLHRLPIASYVSPEKVSPESTGCLSYTPILRGSDSTLR
jgi:hypothetical protein